ncbi:unnamed protein product [Gadus morhua 'NCC']
MKPRTSHATSFRLREAYSIASFAGGRSRGTRHTPRCLDASTPTITSLHIVSFTDDCFLNLVQYKAGLAERLEMESGSVPTLLGSATNLGQQTPDTISIKVEEDIGGGMPAVEDCDAFGDRSTQRSATSESLGVDGPGSSHMSSHSGELKILSVYGKGEGPLAVDGHDTLFTASEVEALNSLSADHSAAKSLERGERLVCHEELSVQQTPDTISIKVEEDIGGGMPAVEDCDAFGDRSTQRGATSESLGVDVPGSSHMSSHSGELKILSVYGEGPLAVDGHDTPFTASEVEALNSLSADHSAAKSLERGERLVCHEELSVQQTPDTFSIKVEEDIGGGMPAVEDSNDIRDLSTQRGDTSESLGVDAPGSHMSSHNGELRILSVYGQGEGPLAVDGHDALFTTSEPEALSSLSVDCSVAKSLNCSVRLVRLEELTGHQGGRKGWPGVLCGKVFSNNDNMIVHMRTKPDEKPYGCHQCTKSFIGKVHLEIHMRTHTGEKPYKCDECAKCFSQSGHLKSHMRTHTGEKPYKCDQCMKLFSLNCHLKSHMRTHTGEKPYRCDQCMKLFKSKTHLKSHMRTHTGEKPCKPYKCDHCAKCFGQTAALQIHIRTHTGEKPYKCDHCAKRFRQTSQLTGHMRTHTGEKPYKCDHCAKGFGHSSHLKNHMRTHTGEMPYKCDQCTKSFGQTSHLKSHMRTHTGEMPYKCDHCAKSFGQPCHLKSHMRTHTGEMPYKCDHCAKSFGHSSQLKRHMWTHTGEMPYKCDQCAKRFVQTSQLKSHMWTHTGEKPYKCDQCAKRFEQTSTLQIHMRTHTGEKPFKCDQCAKRFRQRGSLNVHMRTHTGEKPYKCDQCTERFIYKACLKSHMKTHTGEKPDRSEQMHDALQSENAPGGPHVLCILST